MVYSKAFQQPDEDNSKIRNNEYCNFEKIYNKMDNYHNNNYYIYNDFCKFNCSPLFFMIPFYSSREFDSNIFVNMQMQYNNYLQNSNKKYVNNFNIKNDCILDKNLESNSSSHLSTTSDGDQVSNIKEINEGKNNKENNNLKETIKKGFRDIKEYYNSIESLGDLANLSCFYYCDIETNEDENFFIDMEIKKVVENYKKIIKKWEM